MNFADSTASGIGSANGTNLGYLQSREPTAGDTELSRKNVLSGPLHETLESPRQVAAERDGGRKRAGQDRWTTQESPI
jgi:hypothetical protein